MSTLRSLLTEARQLGVQVHQTQLDAGELGFYDHENRTIAVALGITRAQFICTLAHELAHAYYGEPCESGSGDRRARRRAAALLIDHDQYAAAEAIDSHPGAIAEELGLTLKVVEDFRRYWCEARSA